MASPEASIFEGLPGSHDGAELSVIEISRLMLGRFVRKGRHQCFAVVRHLSEVPRLLSERLLAAAAQPLG
jgi:hypothetical protein